MPSYLDYKDSKNIIIWLFVGILSLGTYVYSQDQEKISKDQQQITSSILQNKKESLSSAEKDKHDIIQFIKLTSESQKRRDERQYYFIRGEVAKIQDEQKAMKMEQKLISIDIAILKAKGK